MTDDRPPANPPERPLIEPTIYVAEAVEDLPVPHVEDSQRGRRCDICLREVWIDPVAYDQAAAGDGMRVNPMRVLCTRCFEKERDL
jgi:hypothetical protein